MGASDAIKQVSKIFGSLDKAVIGYTREKHLILASLISGGHVLLEGIPGIAKTTIVKALARTLGLLSVEKNINGIPFRGFSRIQLTPDLMPSDVTGSLVYNPQMRDFEVKFGPVFAYLLLADEINRATPKTQSALLEAMQERQVTIGRETYRLEFRENGKFFFAIATQNPVEQEGTYPLPEAQLDRFTTRVVMGYPNTLEEEKSILKLHAYRLVEPFEDIGPVVEPSWVISAQDSSAERVRVNEEVVNYVATLIRLTRPEVNRIAGEYFELGASPRAGIALLRMAKAWAFLEGRDYVTKRDVDDVLFAVLNHRVIPRLDRVIEYEEKHGRYAARYKVIADGLEVVKKGAA
ncbi:MAG: MoxR family ATPase [Thermofilaceae archaeon]